jgi:hypothetical protein
VERGCGQGVERALNTIIATSVSAYRETACSGLRVLLHRELPDEYAIESRLPAWLSNVPSEALEDIEIIFFTPHGPDDRGGDYMPSLCSIRVICRAVARDVPWLAPLLARDAEFTLYR